MGRGRGRGPEWYTGNQICFLRGSHKGPSDFNQAASPLALLIDFIGGRSNCVLSPCVSVCYLTSLWLTPPPSFFPSFFTLQHLNSNQHFETCCEKNGKCAKLDWCQSVLIKWKSPFNPNNLTVPMKTIKLRLQTILCCRWLALTQSWEKEHVTSLLFHSVFFTLKQMSVIFFTL